MADLHIFASVMLFHVMFEKPECVVHHSCFLIPNKESVTDPMGLLMSLDIVLRTIVAATLSMLTVDRWEPQHIPHIPCSYCNICIISLLKY